MDLDRTFLDISPRILGRNSVPFTAEVVRELVVEDLALLELTRGNVASLKRLTDRHHALARSLATGMRPGDAALLAGYTPTRVSMLQNDPGFQDLVAFYRTATTRDLRSNFERLSGMAADAADILQGRMEERPDDVSTGQLIEIVKVGADRSGNGPVSGNVTLNVNVNLADRLKRAREAARAASELPALLDVSPNE